MISSLPKSLLRVTLVWYIAGMLLMFLGNPEWAETAYKRLMLYPGVPELKLGGLFTAAKVQMHLLLYWTLPVLVLWVVAILAGFFTAQLRYLKSSAVRKITLKPTGEFWGVVVANYSMGALPTPTTPKYTDQELSLSFDAEMERAVNLLNVAERELFDQLIQLLWEYPDHFAGHGHGVGLLEHTLNVVAEAAPKCTSDFRLPLLAAAAHDIGKLITFKPDGKGGWERRGWHTREGARIIVTLPAFRKLPPMEQTALLLAIKYDHAPSRIPDIQGKRDTTDMALRIINALSQADKMATAAEKDRNLEKLQPEDLLWQDFVDHFRNAPVVQKGKPGSANQVNNPDGPYVFLYEAPWRDAAVTRMPAEVAAALDLTRRDAGKLAKYTRILMERFRKEGVLVESYGDHTVNDDTPLWDIQSGSGEKAVVLRGVIALKQDTLWKVLNYRLGAKSPYPVQILAPTAAADGSINSAPPSLAKQTPDISDVMQIKASSSGDLSFLGLSSEGAGTKPKAARARPRGTGSSTSNDVLGLAPAKPTTQEKKVEPAPVTEAPETATEPQPEPAIVHEVPSVEMAAGDAMASADTPVAPTDGTDTPAGDTDSSSLALALLGGMSLTDELAQDAPAATDDATGYDDPTAEYADPTEPIPESPAPEPEPAAPAAPAAKPAPDLSDSEKERKLAIADDAAIALYPHLKVGQKYYTADSPAVTQGRAVAGEKYSGGADKAKSLDGAFKGPPRRRPH